LACYGNLANGKITKKRFDFSHPFVILEVCNPKEAARVLSENRLVGYFLTCKIVVYKENGTPKIGMPKPTLFMNMANDKSLKSLAEDIEKRLIACLNECRLSLTPILL
jgi:uncharacterized protein (DUF302 family)